MNRPDRDPSLRTVAQRVIALVDRDLRPAFADALVRRVSSGYGLDVTDDERAAVARQLPDAASDYEPPELDVLVVRLLARHRAAAEGARARRETLAAFGGRAQEPVVRDSEEPPAVPLMSTKTGQEDGPPLFADTCAVFDVELVSRATSDIGDIGDDRAVEAAGVLARAYLIGDWARGFHAVDEAVRRLDRGDLWVYERQLLDRMNCWRELRNRVPAAERAGLAATVLGLHDPRRAADVTPDPRIQGLFDTLLDAIDANCRQAYRGESSTVVRGGLRRARQAVRARLTSTVSAGAIMRIKQLLMQFEQARWILAELAPHLPNRGRPQEVEGRSSGEWFALWVLLGDELPDGTDLYTAAVTADAYRVVFEWLAAGGETVDCTDVCEAAALLRFRSRPRTVGTRGE